MSPRFITWQDPKTGIEWQLESLGAMNWFHAMDLPRPSSWPAATTGACSN